MSPPEARLWRILRGRPNGLQFRRQHPLGPYVFDFFCRSAGLAIEVDGQAHDFGDRPGRDIARDQWALAQGVATLRIPASHVKSDLEAVVVMIVSACLDRTPPPAIAGPPPREIAGRKSS